MRPAVIRVDKGVMVEPPHACPVELVADGSRIFPFHETSRAVKAAFGYFEVVWDPCTELERSADSPEILEDHAVYRPVPRYTPEELKALKHAQRQDGVGPSPRAWATLYSQHPDR